MQTGSGRRAIIRKEVAVGSVWERRIKMDELNGGIKVFNGGAECCGDEEAIPVSRRLGQNQGDGGRPEKRKRRSWRQPEVVVPNGGAKGSPIQVKKALHAGIGYQREVGETGVMLITDGKENVEEDDDIEIPIIDDKEEHRSFDDKEIDMLAETQKKVEENAEQVHEIPVLEEEATLVTDLKDEEEDLSTQCEGWKGAGFEDVKFEGITRNHNTMQHIVDLLMWRDVSKTTFVFGFGTFLLLSSSYAKDINFSIVSAISYMGLFYLAAIFLFRSVFRRAEGADFQPHEGLVKGLIGEEDAIWLVRRTLPYLNELLSRIRALFSGDPATTMKMAVILFVMAKCGRSLTVSTLAKMGFFGAFTIPKVLSAYSAQMGRCGRYWLARFRDGWESCTHKKAVAAAVFTLIWNLSSTIARIWAVFMLIILVRLYQQCLMVERDKEEIATNKQLQQQQQQRNARISPSRHGRRKMLLSTGLKGDVQTKKVT